MWCVAELTPQYIRKMEDVLGLYEKPYSASEPVICLDEKPVSLHREVRPPIPAKPGSPSKRDNEYQHCGAANVFGVVDFAAAPLDVAIRRGDFPMDAHWRVEPFMDELIGPVCRPELVPRFEAGGLVRLHSTTRPNAWQTCEELSGTVCPGPVTSTSIISFFVSGLRSPGSALPSFRTPSPWMR